MDESRHIWMSHVTYVGVSQVLRFNLVSNDVERKEDVASVPETHSAKLLPYNLDPTRRKFSRRRISGGAVPFVTHDSITDLRVVPETNLIVT